jgi:predicted amidohydrolase
MIRSLRVAAVQLRAHDRAAFAPTLPAILEQIADATNGAELVVVPEGTFPAYVLGSEPIDRGAVERAVEALRDLARRTRTVIVAGVATAGARQPRNAALVIDRDGTVAGRADKLFLWHFDRRWFEAGDRLAPVSTSIGVLGAFVCADGRIPTIARALVDRGAELLVRPTCWRACERARTACPSWLPTNAVRNSAWWRTAGRAKSSMLRATSLRSLPNAKPRS